MDTLLMGQKVSLDVTSGQLLVLRTLKISTARRKLTSGAAKWHLF